MATAHRSYSGTGVSCGIVALGRTKVECCQLRYEPKNRVVFEA
ncbi:MAG: hypothetical protein AB1Z29_02895 [Desulfobacterales bacterium]